MAANIEALRRRQLLSWEESAFVLGFDLEGLRQAMVQQLNTPGTPEWLPVVVDSRGDDFLAHLSSRDVRVTEPCLNYDEHGVDRPATFDDGSIFETEGRTETASWCATHDHRSGWSMCFLVGGRLILDPHCVRSACEREGDLRHTVLDLAPREWWGEGTAPNHSFITIGPEFAGAFQKLPEDIFRDTFFSASDAFRIAGQRRAGSNDWRSPASSIRNGPWPWGSHQTELLEHLAAAAHEWWSTFDPAQPNTAPKNKEVIDWLLARGVSKRNAEIIATMLRPASIPTGPR